MDRSERWLPAGRLWSASTAAGRGGSSRDDLPDRLAHAADPLEHAGDEADARVRVGFKESDPREDQIHAEGFGIQRAAEDLEGHEELHEIREAAAEAARNRAQAGRVD